MQSLLFMHATAGSIIVPPVSLDIDLLEPIFPVAGRESCSSCSSLSLRPSVIHPSHPSLSVSSAPLLTAEGKSLGALVLLCYLSDVTTQEIV